MLLRALVVKLDMAPAYEAGVETHWGFESLRARHCLSKDHNLAAHRDHDWDAIQKAYDEGLSVRDLVKRFGCANLTIQRAARQGLFVLRGKNDRRQSGLPNPMAQPRIVKSKWVVVEGEVIWPCRRCGCQRATLEAHFCSFLCSTAYRRETYIKRWLDGRASGSGKDGSIRKVVRNYVLREANYTCQWEGCGCNAVNPHTGLPIVQVDHIDGLFDNNLRSNLRVLCPNHHAMTDTYGGQNMGKGRHSRRLHYASQKTAIRSAWRSRLRAVSET